MGTFLCHLWVLDAAELVCDDGVDPSQSQAVKQLGESADEYSNTGIASAGTLSFGNPARLINANLSAFVEVHMLA